MRLATSPEDWECLQQKPGKPVQQAFKMNPFWDEDINLQVSTKERDWDATVVPKDATIQQQLRYWSIMSMEFSVQQGKQDLTDLTELRWNFWKNLP